eukprot:scaffold1461_cov253-Pinguiococcus_pyrenoidosus.AAC.17
MSSSTASKLNVSWKVLGDGADKARKRPLPLPSGNCGGQKQKKKKKKKHPLRRPPSPWQVRDGRTRSIAAEHAQILPALPRFLSRPGFA